MAKSVDAFSDRIRQFVHDLSFYSIAHLVPALLSLGALMLFTRVFSPEMFGRYSLALAVAGITSTLLYGWLDYSVLRYAPQLDEEIVLRNIYSLYVGISVLLLFLATVGYLLGGYWLGPYTIFFFPALALAIARGGIQVLLAFFRSVLNSPKVTLFRVMRAVISVTVSVVLALIVLEHIVGWILGATIGIVVTCVYIFVSSETVRGVPLFDREMINRLFRYGVPMVGFIIGDAFLVQADRVLLELLGSSIAVGIYSANYMLVDRGLRLAYTPIIQAITPIIIDSWDEGNEQEIGTMIHNFSRYFILLGIPALVLVAVLSKTVSTLLVGEEFTSGFVIIPVVAIGLFFWSLANLIQVIFEIKEETAMLSYGIVGVIAVNLVLNVPLITTLGYFGAAVATTVSYTLYLLFVMRLSSRYLSWEFPVVCLRNAVVGAILMLLPTVILYVFDSYTLVSSLSTAAIGTLFYLVSIYLLDEIGQAEIEQIRQFLE
ncbi:hypothetical protein Harman_31480 [Haloarcula mannanilytica]|uniref:Uncharacterized protein n=1 Tax=Haloarcula mannanilytica TaxID=2509225 RepID=A0A4C2ERJ2_9EURY|nr:oligosaccharide flippase family protein [Haloarcula mannanilytica]GCF15213.1 hypothetical protein Harman_31480 [Haloarcula mannanilytica]